MKIPQVLTAGECGQICWELRNIKHRAMVMLMYDGALRLSEVCNMQVKHVDGKLSQVFIEQSKGAKDRYVPIQPGTLNLLRDYWKKYRPHGFLFWSESQYMVPYASRTLQYLVGKAAVKALHKHVNCHLLRHSRATHLLNAGMSIYDLSTFLGHANIETTTVYLHTATERLRGQLEIYGARVTEQMAAVL